MSTISIAGNTWGYNLGINCFENISTVFSNTKESCSGLTGSLASLKNKIDIAQIAVNTDSSSDSILKAKEREEVKSTSLSVAYDKLDALVNDAGVIDTNVSSKISQRKNDFYNKYDYLKPDSEKTEKELKAEARAQKWQDFLGFCSGVAEAAGKIIKNVGDWCKEHWKAVVTGIIVVIAVVGLVALSLVPG